MKVEISPGEWRDIKAPQQGTRIPFIRAYPSGEHHLTEIERPLPIYVKACRFISVGGRYLIAVVPTTNNTDVQVEMIAAMLVERTGNIHDPLIEVAKETCPNMEAVVAAVDRLVLASVNKLDEAQ